MKKLFDLGYINLITYPGTHGSVISLQGYMSTMFQVSDALVDKEEIAMSLCIKLKTHEVEDEIVSDSVSKPANSVSKLKADLVTAKIVSFINAQGFSCSNCGRLEYISIARKVLREILERSQRTKNTGSL